MRFWDQQDKARRETAWLLCAFALCVLALVVAVHVGLTLAWLLVRWGIFRGQLDYPAGFLAVNVGVTLLLVMGGWWIEMGHMRQGGQKLAQRVGAREARPGSSLQEQQVVNIVQEMCIAASMPVPQVVVLTRTEAINAFAAGWDQDDAIVAVTQGALEHLNRDELQGMLAHELSHLHEGDTRLNMRLAAMCFGLELVYTFGESMRERGTIAWWFGTAVMAAGFMGWLCGRLLKAAVGRRREFLADARAVQWSRNRDGLGNVLRKVLWQREQEAHSHSLHYLEQRSHHGLHHPLVQHMLLVEVPDSSRLEHWLDAHPPLQDRLKVLYGRRMRSLPLGADDAQEPASKVVL